MTKIIYSLCCYLTFCNALIADEFHIFEAVMKTINVSTFDVYPKVEISKDRNQLVRVALYEPGKDLGKFQIDKKLEELLETKPDQELKPENIDPFLQETKPCLFRKANSNIWYLVQYEHGFGLRFLLFRAKPMNLKDGVLILYSNSEPITSSNKDVLQVLKKVMTSKIE